MRSENNITEVLTVKKVFLHSLRKDCEQKVFRVSTMYSTALKHTNRAAAKKRQRKGSHTFLQGNKAQILVAMFSMM